MWHRGLPMFRFTERWRAAAGLEKLYSDAFYNGTLTNAPSTHGRREAGDAVEWIEKTFRRRDGTSHICLHVPTGVTLRDPKSTSRVNPTNIAVVVRYVRHMLQDGLWKPHEITIETPYRAQATLYRQLIQLLKLGQINVSTVDSMQGRENECVIFDPTVSSIREQGGVGFIVDRKRLNVAVSRARNMFLLVGDTSLKDGKIKSASDLGKIEKELQKNIARMYGHFETQRMVYLVDRTKFEEMGLLNMSTSEAVYNRALRGVCDNCLQPGHKRADCPEPKNTSRPQRPATKCPCKLCNSREHQIAECPDVVCKNCNEKGHMANECNKIVYSNCHKEGHKRKGTETGEPSATNNNGASARPDQHPDKWRNIRVDSQLVEEAAEERQFDAVTDRVVDEGAKDTEGSKLHDHIAMR
ncbi:MAG: hypothetical protein Q9166_004706 [cf. Caloplaca sp. 2 TL-2023]